MPENTAISHETQNAYVGAADSTSTKNTDNSNSVTQSVKTYLQEQPEVSDIEYLIDALSCFPQYQEILTKYDLFTSEIESKFIVIKPVYEEIIVARRTKEQRQPSTKTGDFSEIQQQLTKFKVQQTRDNAIKTGMVTMADFAKQLLRILTSPSSQIISDDELALQTFYSTQLMPNMTLPEIHAIGSLFAFYANDLLCRYVEASTKTKGQNTKLPPTNMTVETTQRVQGKNERIKQHLGILKALTWSNEEQKRITCNKILTDIMLEATVLYIEKNITANISHKTITTKTNDKFKGICFVDSTFNDLKTGQEFNLYDFVKKTKTPSELDYFELKEDIHKTYLRWSKEKGRQSKSMESLKEAVAEAQKQPENEDYDIQMTDDGYINFDPTFIPDETTTLDGAKKVLYEALPRLKAEQRMIDNFIAYHQYTVFNSTTLPLIIARIRSHLDQLENQHGPTAIRIRQFLNQYDGIMYSPQEFNNICAQIKDLIPDLDKFIDDQDTTFMLTQLGNIRDRYKTQFNRHPQLAKTRAQLLSSFISQHGIETKEKTGDGYRIIANTVYSPRKFLFYLKKLQIDNQNIKAKYRWESFGTIELFLKDNIETIAKKYNIDLQNIATTPSEPTTNQAATIAPVVTPTPDPLLIFKNEREQILLAFLCNVFGINVNIDATQKKQTIQSNINIAAQQNTKINYGFNIIDIYKILSALIFWAEPENTEVFNTAADNVIRQHGGRFRRPSPESKTLIAALANTATPKNEKLRQLAIYLGQKQNGGKRLYKLILFNTGSAQTQQNLNNISATDVYKLLTNIGFWDGINSSAPSAPTPIPDVFAIAPLSSIETDPSDCYKDVDVTVAHEVFIRKLYSTAFPNNQDAKTIELDEAKKKLFEASNTHVRIFMQNNGNTIINGLQKLQAQKKTKQNAFFKNITDQGAVTGETRAEKDLLKLLQNEQVNNKLKLNSIAGYLANIDNYAQPYGENRFKARRLYKCFLQNFRTLLGGSTTITTPRPSKCNYNKLILKSEYNHAESFAKHLQINALNPSLKAILLSLYVLYDLMQEYKKPKKLVGRRMHQKPANQIQTYVKNITESPMSNPTELQKKMVDNIKLIVKTINEVVSQPGFNKNGDFADAITAFLNRNFKLYYPPDPQPVPIATTTNGFATLRKYIKSACMDFFRELDSEATALDKAIDRYLNPTQAQNEDIGETLFAATEQIEQYIKSIFGKDEQSLQAKANIYDEITKWRKAATDDIFGKDHQFVWVGYLDESIFTKLKINRAMLHSKLRPSTADEQLDALGSRNALKPPEQIKRSPAQQKRAEERGRKYQGQLDGDHTYDKNPSASFLKKATMIANTS